MQKTPGNHEEQPMSFVRGIVFVALLGAFLGLFLYFSSAEPGGPTITYVSNSSTDTSAGESRSDPGGIIYTVTVSAILQNTNWKAYVGNVTGQLTLDDASGYTIYDWQLATPTGEIYVSRRSSITWGSIGCGSSSNVSTEQSQLLMTSTAVDNINNTFNESVHRSFLVGSTNITGNTCRAAYTYVNDSRQVANSTNFFTEVLLSDGSSLVYTTFIEADRTGYDPGKTYDFQAIVAENVSASGPDITYYFWVELG